MEAHTVMAAASLYLFGGHVTINDSTISSNISSGSGGGIENVSTTVLNNSTVSGNSPSYNGGGIETINAPTITNCTISGNTAGTTSDGGGIYGAGGLTQILTVSQHLAEAAIVVVLMDLEHQTGEELLLGKLFRSEAVSVCLKRSPGDLMGDEQHHPWRLAGGSHRA
jgi:hypothetical protein